MKILIASYARSGSTSLERAFLALAAGTDNPTTLHEPFSKYWGPDQVDFDQLSRVVESTDLIKHHPGNILSDRQNRQLYADWITAGGCIVHLSRQDVRAQAKSLVIARGLNSFRRPHNVGSVPQDRLDAEHGDLLDEVAHQSAVLALFDHVAITYEELLHGPIEKRLTSFGHLIDQIDPRLADVFATPTGRDAVAQVLAPSRQTRLLDASQSTGTRLVDQVPRFSGSFPLLSPQEVTTLRALIDAQNTASNRRHGVVSCALDDVLPPALLQELTDRISDALIAGNGPRIEGPPIAFCGMQYRPAIAPDHDLVLSDPPLATCDQTLHFAVSLGCVDGTADVLGGAVHLAGRGTQPSSRTIGAFFYFASGIGARREPVESGRLCALVGSFALAPGQILCAGQILGDAGMFQSSDADSTMS